MRRVIWPFVNTSGVWTGGSNYFRNLAKAVLSLPSPRIEILLTGDTGSLEFPLNTLSTLRLPHLRRFSPHWWMNRLTARLSSDGGNLALALAKHRIALWSHGYPLGRYSPVPSLCWIPDFQEIHLPGFFTAREREKRIQSKRRMAASAQGILLSSWDAHTDFCRLFPESAHKAHVLRFVADIPPISALPSAETVLRKHAIEEPYFHVPNQLWSHKNHLLILDALRCLKKDGLQPLVISTGLMSDGRNPEFPARLQEQVRTAGFAERFRFLGLVPFADVATLMRESIALINPSRFEGWSTTVEEAKSAGKQILLSDLRVHREQAPPRGSFFGPDDAHALAACMRDALRAYDPEAERMAMEEAKALLPERLQAYGKAYEELALSVIDHSARTV
ncbi:MAG: glycosyltransferase family 4 protein [Candidatus Accumulibacter sp.]|jgi:glycosyltransferase involved in cell wall biosynthesis|nr:glycosyltransferase family 4 protein [Accumulibacter sp.]